VGGQVSFARIALRGPSGWASGPRPAQSTPPGRRLRLTCSSHISAVERAGLNGLNEGQKIVYEIVTDKRTGKSSADKLKPA
jgi:hypothetical protein